MTEKTPFSTFMVIILKIISAEDLPSPLCYSIKYIPGLCSPNNFEEGTKNPPRFSFEWQQVTCWHCP